jgi:tRNA (mo5U34)-methyltransferase
MAAVCKVTLFVQSLMRGSAGEFTPADNYSFEDNSFFEAPDFPSMYFIEKSFHADESNWWIPNRSCLKAMLRVSGFKETQDSSAEDHFICKK